MSRDLASPEEKASREELIKVLSEIRRGHEEPEKQEEKMESAYGFCKLITSHKPVWEY
jgi:hypothetical protein